MWLLYFDLLTSMPGCSDGDPTIAARAIDAAGSVTPIDAPSGGADAPPSSVVDSAGQPIDAPLGDAVVGDAPSDATGDALSDSQADAPVDGGSLVDAPDPLDAALVDGPTVDAPFPVDASFVDAPDLDAAFVDAPPDA